MDDQFLQVGAGGLFALLVLREVFGFLKEKVRAQSNLVIDNMAKQIQELHEWHAVTDEDGVKIWYLRRSLENAIEKLTSNLDIQTQLLREMVLILKDSRNEMDAVIRETREIHREIRNEHHRKAG
ncbi:MAG: hypothetical protein K2Q12_05665 [Rickettsiales bacterium]|nr:hypothetical protein [Rickettsiales bacterium]NBX02601.1 hypothetical protein [Alphaproteobacteria bacterium]